MQLGSAGYLTEGEYTGYYSVNEESFLQEKDLVRDEATGCLQTAAGEKVELIREKNYLFMMTEEMRVRRPSDRMYSVSWRAEWVRYR